MGGSKLLRSGSKQNSTAVIKKTMALATRRMSIAALILLLEEFVEQIDCMI